jgi:hypothetical protein
LIEQGVTTLTDLAKYMNDNNAPLKLCVESEFYSRPDGLSGLQTVYDFAFSEENILVMEANGYHSTKWWRIKDEFSGVCHGVLGVQKAAVGSERITIREQTSNDRSARWPWPAFVVANVGDGVGQSWVGAGNDGKYRSYKWSPRETWLYAKSPDVWPHGDCAESGSPGVRERLR